MMLMILRETKTRFSHEITPIFKCHRDHSGHSLGDTSGPRQHPPVWASPALSSPPPHLPVRPGWGQPPAGHTHSPPCLSDSGTGQRGPLQAEHAGGDHAQRGACCGGVWVAGRRAPWVGWGGAAELRHSQAHLAWSVSPLPPPRVCPPISLLSWPLGLCPTLFLSVSPVCVFVWFSRSAVTSCPPSPRPPPHVSLWAPPSPVASFLPDREDYSVWGHPWPVL